MSDPRLARLAEVLVGYSAGVKPGELVLLESAATVEPLVEELYGAVLRAGAMPATRTSLDLTDVLLFEGSDDQVEWVNPARREDIEPPTCGSWWRGLGTRSRSPQSHRRGRRSSSDLAPRCVTGTSSERGRASCGGC